MTIILGQKYNNNSLAPLFQGYNTLTKELTKPAVTGGKTDPYSGEAEFNMYYEESAIEFVSNQESNLSADISLAGFFGANGKLDQGTKQKMNSLTSLIIIQVKSIKGTVSVDDYNFIESPPAEEELEAFKKIYGDCFVSSYQFGGAFSLVLNLSFTDQEQKEKFQSEAGLGGVIKMVTFDFSAKQRLEKALHQNNIRFEIDIKVKGRTKPQMPVETQELGKWMAYGLKFPDQTMDSPVIIAHDFKGYEQVSMKVRVFDVMAKNREQLVGPLSNNTQGLIKKRAQIRYIKNELDFVQTAYERYNSNIDDAKMNQALEIIPLDLQSIQDAIDNYNASPGTLLDPIILKSLKIGVPQIKMTWPKLYGPFGGAGGGTIDDFGNSQSVLKNWVHTLPKITTIQISQGNYDNKELARSLVVEYENKVRTADPNFYNNNMQKIVCGEPQNNAKQLTLNTNVFVKTASVRAGVFVDWLKFEATTGDNI